MWYVENNLFFNEPPYPHMKTFEIVQALKLKLIEALLQGHVFLGMLLLLMRIVFSYWKYVPNRSYLVRYR